MAAREALHQREHIGRRHCLALAGRHAMRHLRRNGGVHRQQVLHEVAVDKTAAAFVDARPQLRLERPPLLVRQLAHVPHKRREPRLHLCSVLN